MQRPSPRAVNSGVPAEAGPRPPDSGQGRMVNLKVSQQLEPCPPLHSRPLRPRGWQAARPTRPQPHPTPPPCATAHRSTPPPGQGPAALRRACAGACAGVVRRAPAVTIPASQSASGPTAAPLTPSSSYPPRTSRVQLRLTQMGGVAADIACGAGLIEGRD